MAALDTPADVKMPDVAVQTPSFAELRGSAPGAAAGSLHSVLNVQVTVTAELGRTTLPINEILKLGAGAVLELDRAVTEPVDLVVQGVKLARGEVVVVGDRFAIRITEIIEKRD